MACDITLSMGMEWGLSAEDRFGSLILCCIKLGWQRVRYGEWDESSPLRFATIVRSTQPPPPPPLRLDFATVACSSQNSELRGPVGLENSPSKFWKVLRAFRMIALVLKRSGLFWAQWRVNIWNCLWMVQRVKIIQNGGLKISGKSNVAKRAKSLVSVFFFSLA